MLRPYQQTLINQASESYKTYKSPCIVSPCGSGKSILIAEIAKRAADKKNRVLFLVHRKELIEQIEATFKMWGVDMEYVQLAMVQTVVRRLGKTLSPTLIITDESHHGLANSYKKIYEYFGNAKRIGFTATPIRLNGGGLGEVNDVLVIGPTVRELIEWGNLSPFKYYAPVIVDTSKLRTQRGEYNQEDIATMFAEKAIWGDVIKHYKKLSDGKQAICYCSSIKQSIQMAEEFNSNGITARHIDGETPKIERAEVIQQFRAGKILILCNVDLISEGFDVPDCNTAILLRPTQSLSLYIQQSMRCMRYKEGKIAIIIDHVGNVERFGLPDMERQWKLDPKKGSNKTVELAPVKQCPECFYTVLASVVECPQCGYLFRAEVKEVERIDSDLVEVTEDKEFTVDYREPRDCKSMAELCELAKNRGYKKGWAFYQGKILNLI